MQEFMEYLQKFDRNLFSRKLEFIGVVEDINDPMTLGRVKVRAFNVHPEDQQAVPTDDLPWAIVLQPTTSASISGIGWSPNGLEAGSWVHGYFMDGEDAQYPIVDGVFPVIHRGNPPGQPGGSAAGYLDPSADFYQGTTEEVAEGTRPYHGETVENFDYVPGKTPTGSIDMPNQAGQGEGAMTAVGDVNHMLTPKDAPRWDSLGLPTYSWKAAPDGYACKDGKGSLRFHYGTALAFEKLTKMEGAGKLSITSAYRTPAYNSRLKGAARNSMHIHGRALDIAGYGYGNASRAKIAAFAKKAVQCGFVGFGLYNSFIHIDTGTGRTWGAAKQGWFIEAIKSAGWVPGKKGLDGVATNPGAGTGDGTGTPADGAGTGTPGSTTPGAGGVGSGSGMSTNGEVAQYVQSRLKSEGFSDIQTAAVMSHAQNESGFNPNAVGDGGAAYGIFQWNDRRPALINYANSRGLAVSDPRTQMDFFMHEMRTGDGVSAKLGQLKGATTLSEANRVMANYERYSGYQSGSGETAQRLRDAQAIYGGNFTPGNTPIKGFVDPTNSLPYTGYRGEPSTHVNARGFNSYLNQLPVENAEAARASGFPIAGDIGTFGMQENLAAPQYPYNKVFATKSGHMIEFDDTPGAERIRIHHKSGAAMELSSDGTVSLLSQQNMQQHTKGDLYMGVGGKAMITSVNDMHIRSTADMVQHADGSMTLQIGNDGSMVMSGDFEMAAGEDLKIKGTKLIIEAATVDILSLGDFNIEAKAALNLKGATMNVQSDGDINIKGGGDIFANPSGAMKVGEGGVDLPGAESTDIGAVPARTVVNKTSIKGSPSVTSSSGAGYYRGVE